MCEFMRKSNDWILRKPSVAVSFLKSKIRLKKPDHLGFSFRKEQCIQKGLLFFRFHGHHPRLSDKLFQVRLA